MNFESHERGQLARLADVLIPAAEGHLSASQAGVAEEGLRAVLAARPDLAAPLRTLLIKTQGQEPAVAIAGLQASDPAAFAVLAEVAASAYFLNPQVQAAIGYRGQTPRPMDPRPDYMDDGLLDSVIRRGPVFRPTPKDYPADHSSGFSR
jgi:hypothetical protein